VPCGGQGRASENTPGTLAREEGEDWLVSFHFTMYFSASIWVCFSLTNIPKAKLVIHISLLQMQGQGMQDSILVRLGALFVDVCSILG